MARDLWATATVSIPGTDGYFRAGDKLPAEALKALDEKVYADGEEQSYSHLDALMAGGAITDNEPAAEDAAEAEAGAVAAGDEAALVTEQRG